MGRRVITRYAVVREQAPCFVSFMRLDALAAAADGTDARTCCLVRCRVGGDISATFTSPVKAHLRGKRQGSLESRAPHAASADADSARMMGVGSSSRDKFVGEMTASSLTGQLTVVDVEDWSSQVRRSVVATR